MEIDMEGEGMGGGMPLHANESEVDLKAVAQKEYQRMKRQYFLMQRNRQSLMERAGSKMARSQKLVKVLEVQRDNLESDLSAATSVANQRKDEATKEKIWKLLQMYEKYKGQSEKLSKEIDAMEKTVIKMTTKFYKAKLHIQAVLGVATPIARIERTIENNEKKLHTIKSHYDTLMTENRLLKDDIGIKINRRFVIFQRMDRLHKRMSECRRELHTSVDEALQVYNVWDDAARKISFIKEKYKDEVRQHLLEMKEYDRLLFHDLREIRFYSTKNKPRALVEDVAQREARKNQKEVGQLEKEVRRYKKQFTRLEEFDPMQDVDAIISNYKLLEQKNFGYFQQISDFNKESMKLMEEIHDLKIELDEIAQETEEQTKSNAEELTRLELTRDLEKEKLEYTKAQLGATEESTKRIFAAVEAFLETAECNKEPLQELLGDSEKVNSRNILATFNILEHHIAAMQLEKEILKIQKDIETHSAHATYKQPKVHKPVGGPFEPTLVISGRPELGMEKKDDEEDTLFASHPIPKAVQREHLLSQLRDLGVVASPPVYAPSESTTAISGKSAGKASMAAKSKDETAEVDGDDEGDGEEEEDKSDVTSEPAPPTTDSGPEEEPAGPTTDTEQDEEEEEETE